VCVCVCVCVLIDGQRFDLGCVVCTKEREAGIVGPKTKKSKKGKKEMTTDVRAYINQLRGNRRGRDPTQVDAPSVGTFRDGTLIISKHDIERIKHKRKREREGSAAPPPKRRRHS
jgi:hypothetical protein